MPKIVHRCSSSTVRSPSTCAAGSSNASLAVSKLISCFARLARFLFSSQVKRIKKHCQPARALELISVYYIVTVNFAMLVALDSSGPATPKGQRFRLTNTKNLVLVNVKAEGCPRTKHGGLQRFAGPTDPVLRQDSLAAH
jgi:hypothetical protein